MSENYFLTCLQKTFEIGNTIHSAFSLGAVKNASKQRQGAVKWPYQGQPATYVRWQIFVRQLIMTKG